MSGFNDAINHLFQCLQPAAYIVHIHLVADGGILLGGKPDQDHGYIILHILACKIGFEFKDLVINGLCCFSHHLFIGGFNADAVSTVTNNKVQRDQIIHIYYFEL